MTAESLGFIARRLKSIGINYCFEQWGKEVCYPYFVGDYIEVESENEDGQRESEFILTGVSKGSRLALENDKEKILSLFPDTGMTHIFDDGSAIAVMYGQCEGIPSENDELKRIQINLKILEWSVK